MGHVARVRDKNAYEILIGKAGRKRRLGRPEHRWEDYENGFWRYRLWKRGLAYGWG